MRNIHPRAFLSIGLALLFSAFVTACSSDGGLNVFGYNDIQEALDNIPDSTDTATAIDTNDDGIADAIDTNNDGTPDITVNPGTGNPTDPGSSTDDPPIRDPETGSCNLLGTMKTVSGNFTGDPGRDNLVIMDISSNGTTVTIDLQGHSVKRIIVNKISGSNNRLNVQNAVMTQGFCNNSLSGGSNSIVVDALSSAPVVDLMSGSGGSHNFDTLFQPSTGLKYDLSGNNHCLSVPSGTTILTGSVSNDNGHEILTDGSTCL